MSILMRAHTTTLAGPTIRVWLDGELQHWVQDAHSETGVVVRCKTEPPNSPEVEHLQTTVDDEWVVEAVQGRVVIEVTA